MSINITAIRTAAEVEAAQVAAPQVEQITDPNDPRLVSFWEAAHAIAVERDYCEVYDSITAQLGLDSSKARNRRRRVSNVTISKQFKIDGEEEPYEATYTVYLSDYIADESDITWDALAPVLIGSTGTIEKAQEFVETSLLAAVKRLHADRVYNRMYTMSTEDFLTEFTPQPVEAEAVAS